MAEIRLHPSGRLVLDGSEQEAAQSKALRTLQAAFRKDWRAGLFCLAADTSLSDLPITMRFWRTLAADYLTKLCHLPDTDQGVSVQPPSASQLAHWVLAAPPMPLGSRARGQRSSLYPNGLVR